MKDHIRLLATLDFPSDQLKIGTLRRRFPQSFDQAEYHDLSSVPFIDDNDSRNPSERLRQRLYDLLDGDRQVALNALVKAEGSTRTDWMYTPEEQRERLIELYQDFGLAEGPEHAKQLIRDLESAAAALAKGKSRS
jgi:hypothetical protein